MNQDAQTLKPGELELGGKVEYALAPEGEPLEFHVVDVAKQSIKRYQSEEMEPGIKVTAVLDSDGEAKGQKFSFKFPLASKGARSTQFKFIKAVFGEAEKVDAADLIGRPFQAILENKVKEDATFQNFSVFMRPSKTQVRVDLTKDVTPTDQQVEQGLSAEEMDAILK